MSIIIVDDNETNQLVIENILKSAGYNDLLKVFSAKELFHLLDKVSIAGTEVSVNLILMDMMMPVMEGIEATKLIQLDARFCDIPVIFVTAIGDSNNLAEALDAGATDYVMKPINKVELLARIRSALKLKDEKDWHKERNKRIKFELVLAKQVQRSVLNEPIDDENVKIHAVYQPSSELAGDFYAWYPIGKNRYGIILLDMMGHGISSSLVCMFISSVLQDIIKRISDPVQVMKELNRTMNQLDMTDELSNYYFTAIYVLLDVEKKTIEYVNAGHPPGIIYIDDQAALMTEGCCAIGFFENIEVGKGSAQYKNYVKIILFTDGLIGRTDDDKVDGIHKLTNEFIQNRDLDFPELVHKFIPDENNGIQHDDICLVMIATK
jgi:sigma-B regulation protein RsbU (phosphoserine phosphatase)